MSKRRYKEYLRDVTAAIPRTTRWRCDRQYENAELMEEIDIHCDYPSATNNTNAYERVVEFTYPSSEEDETIIDETALFESNFCPDSSSGSDYDCPDLSDGSSDTFHTDEESSSDDDYNEEENLGMSSTNGGNQPIYEGANISRNQSLLLLMSFTIKHQLTDDAVNDFLTIMNIHFPNVVPESKYLFYKKFNYQTFVRHYFCGNCTFYFGPNDQIDPDIQCSCPKPNSVVAAKENKWYFMYWSLESQLKLLLQDDAIADCLLNRDEKDHCGDITDATDGDLYKQLKEVHGYGNNDLSLLWNADGVPVFRSSSQDLWPIQCTVLELPIHLRKGNVIMPALWFSKCQLNMDLLLHPFVEETEHLATEGFVFNGQKIKVFAPICSADAPARPKLRNTKQFNGLCGCDWCVHAGVQVVRGRGCSRVYPFDEAQKERTHSEMELLAIKAIETNTPQYGVKGPSMLSKLSHFDLVNGFVPDFLHCALLGVTRQLVSLWFDTTNHEHPWYIGQPSKLARYDAQLKNVVVPKEVRRLPRSIKTREHWKANEYKTFVLYYSLVVLQGILPSRYLSHFFLFVWSLHKLLGTQIIYDDLARVRAALDIFIVKMEELYGIGSCTFNVHQLSHLVKSTMMCGPLWAVSTFTFESNNGVLKKMFQGTQYISHQVCQTYAIMKTLPVMMKQSDDGNENVSEVLQRLVYGKKETTRAVRLSADLVALSKARIRNISEEERLTMALSAGGVVNRVVYEYNRFTWKQKLYDTELYHRSSKRKNCFIKAIGQRSLYYKIKALVSFKECSCDIQHHEQCNCAMHIALICMPLKVVSSKLFKHDSFNISSDFLLEVSECIQSMAIVQLDDIVTKCVKVEHSDKTYLVEMPNMVEFE